MCAHSDPDDKQIQKELRSLKALIKEEQAASAKLFKGALGPAPKPKPGGSSLASRDAAAAAAAAAATGGGSAAAAAGAVDDDDDPLPLEGQERSLPPRQVDSGGGGLLQRLLALLASLIAWLCGLVGIGRKPHAA
jgi:hypothetical protein